MITRRRMLIWGGRALLAVGGGLGLSGCATPRVPRAANPISLGSLLASKLAGERDHPARSDPRSASYAQHVARPSFNEGGVDYRPARLIGDTAISAVADGVVIGCADNARYAGMSVAIAHGLGWKSEYAHLQARHVRVGDRVQRREVIAVMGRSGRGANRSGVVEPHLHLTLRGPLYSPLFADIAMQEQREEPTPAFRYVLDPEEFSLAGKGAQLPYPEQEDSQYDQAFRHMHLAAVAECDALLDRLSDLEGQLVRLRHPAETAMQFDCNVDYRIAYLRQRLAAGNHPFDPAHAAAYHARLIEFMRTVPRLTAPVVAPDRRREYRLRRPNPVKTFGVA
jgi:murein DD-endopeptidase MepM/ murein hydrolase activator NlpD